MIVSKRILGVLMSILDQFDNNVGKFHICLKFLTGMIFTLLLAFLFGLHQ